MPIIYLNKQAICLETIPVNKQTSPKGSGGVGLKHALLPFQRYLHPFSSFLQIKAQITQTCRLETSFAQTNKSSQAKGNWDPPPIPAFIQQNRLWAQLPGKASKYLIFISRLGGDLILKGKTSLVWWEAEKPRQASPCHPVSSSQREKSYHPTWLGEFNPKRC